MEMSSRRRNELLFVFLAFITVLCFCFSFPIPGFLFLVLTVVYWSGNKKWESAFATGTNIQYAGFWSRLGSLSVDAGIECGLWIAIYFLIGDSFIGSMSEQGIGIAQCIFLLLLVKKFGQSPGKMIFGIQIVKEDLGPLEWKQVLLRDWFGIFSSFYYLLKLSLIRMAILTPELTLNGADPQNDLFSSFNKGYLFFMSIWYLSEPFVLLTNERKRALHDFLADTVVVQKTDKKGSVYLSLLMCLICVGFFWSDMHLLAKGGFSKDLVKAKNGDVIAASKVGRDYYSGWGIEKNYTESLHWFEIAATAGNQEAEEYLGMIYERGHGVVENRSEAIKWYSLAAKGQNAKAARSSKKALKRLGVDTP